MVNFSYNLMAVGLCQFGSVISALPNQLLRFNPLCSHRLIIVTGCINLYKFALLYIVQVFILLYPPAACQIFVYLIIYMHNNYFSFVLFSSFSTSHCGSWTCWSGLSPAWFCTNYTLCCAPSAGTTLCLWALFSAATTMSFLNCSETALCWAKPTPTLCPPTAWGSSRSKGFSQSDLTYELWTWRGYGRRSGKDRRVDLALALWG